MATLEAIAPIVRSFRAHPSSLYQVRQFVRQQADVANLGSDLTDDLLLAASEASINAILHSGTRIVRVAWRYKNGCAEVLVQDDGVFQRRLPMPELEDSHGRGILLMMAVMDEVSIQEGTPRRRGTHVRLRKCMPRS
jgi:anti-sigma regulatory factor (Ser/Thr protein kinase)